MKERLQKTEVRPADRNRVVPRVGQPHALTELNGKWRSRHEAARRSGTVIVLPHSHPRGKP